MIDSALFLLFVCVHLVWNHSLRNCVHMMCACIVEITSNCLFVYLCMLLREYFRLYMCMRMGVYVVCVFVRAYVRTFFQKWETRGLNIIFVQLQHRNVLVDTFRCI